MLRYRFWRFLQFVCAFALVTSIALSIPSANSVFAQDANQGNNGNNGGDNGNNGGDNNDGEDGPDDGQAGGNTVIFGEQPGAGVVVDALGVLSVKRNIDRTGKLDRKRRQQAIANLNPDVAKPSKMRMISLTRLEK